MSSVLQSVFAIDTFSLLLLESLEFYKKEASENFIKRRLPLTVAFSNLLKSRCLETNSTVFLRDVLGCVSSAADKFRNNHQEDAHEFLISMLSQLQSEFNEAVRQLNGRRPHFLQSSDPIRECFGYTLRRIFSCRKCHHETSVEESNTNVIIQISDERLKSRKFTFADILCDSMAEENVDHVCDKCKASEAVISYKFLTLPENFIFVIPRSYYKNNRRYKLHANVSMHKYLTFVTSEVIPKPQNLDNQLNLAAIGEEEAAISSVNFSPGIDDQWRNRKINSSKTGYVVADEEDIIHQAFENLLKWRRENLNVKARTIACNTVSDEPNENAKNLLSALSGGNEALFAKIREMIWKLLITNADLYAIMFGKSEKAFRNFVESKNADLPPSNLELHGCAALFGSVINVKEGENWISYIPRFVKIDDARKVVTSKHFHRKRLFLPVNVNYLASLLHLKQAQSYSLSAVVRHLGRRAESGHYKCAVKMSTGGAWSMCDDNVVTHCHEKTVLDKSSASGYILFYSVCKDRSPSPKLDRPNDTEGQTTL